MFANLWQDVRYASRRLVAQPGFTLVAVLTLALGIGATTAIFSVVNGVLLKPLPFDEPERLVGVYHRGGAVNLAVMNQGPATYFTYRDNQRVFEDIGGWEANQVSITGRGEPERAEVLSVTHTTLPLLRVQPALGRLFSKEDDAPGGALRVVLTHGYWQRKFGGAPDVVGTPIDIDGAVGEIIGVLPASFRFLRVNPDLLLPMQLERVSFVMFDFQALARLKPGVTLSQANADVARMIPFLKGGTRTAPAAAERATAVRRRDRRHRACPLGSPRSRRGRAAHRLRERGKPLSRTRRGPPAGAGDACGAGRKSRPHRARAAVGSRCCWDSRPASSVWPSPRLPSACCAGWRPPGCRVWTRSASTRSSCSSRARSRCCPACCSASSRSCDSGP